MTFHDAWQKFKAVAEQEGCTVKIYGDYAFRARRRKGGKYKYIRLAGAKNNDIQYSITWIN